MLNNYNAQALEWYAGGVDSADTLHLAVCGKAVIHTLDRDFCKSAREVGTTPKMRVLQF